MKKKLSGFAAGFLTCALIVSMAGTALAAYTRTATLDFVGIKLVLDGKEIAVTDSTGASIEPFGINGTTYLPLGNIAKLLGVSVSWDQATKTITMTTPGYQAPATTPSTEPTLGEKNALEKAKSYLKYSAFSYAGLIEQLEYEGFSTAEATYGADYCGANWNEQAAKKAESYLKYSSFSRQGLIDQLEHEGFTHEQAVYGVTQVGY